MKWMSASYSTRSRYKNVIAGDVILEKMVLLVSSKGDYTRNSSIRLSWILPLPGYIRGAEIVRWHDYWWRSDIHPYAQVDTASNLTCSPNGVTWNR